MAGTDTGAVAEEPAVVRLSDLRDGQEAVCFAALVNKVRNSTYKGDTFLKCLFRDRFVTLEAPVWSDSRLRMQAESWAVGIAFRLHVRAALKPRYGLQLEILDARPASDELDAADGYNFYELVESSDRDPELLFQNIIGYAERGIDDPLLRRLVLGLLREHAELFKKLPAAAGLHHPYTGGLVEHVWSMTRTACWLADHYARYYDKLDPPLNKGVIVAATVLHDIGKLRELAYHPVESKYTKEGCLIGHILMGRDLVRQAAREVEGFPEETLLLLEHAILSHHGRREFGSPVVPQTLEALLVSFVDDLDAKMNAAARERLTSQTDGEFTDKVWCLDNRRIYKGVPAPPPAENGDGLGPD
jgi:3'-5' exoribonuclease